MTCPRPHLVPTYLQLSPRATCRWAVSRGIRSHTLAGEGPQEALGLFPLTGQSHCSPDRIHPTFRTSSLPSHSSQTGASGRTPPAPCPGHTSLPAPHAVSLAGRSSKTKGRQHRTKRRKTHGEPQSQTEADLDAQTFNNCRPHDLQQTGALMSLGLGFLLSHLQKGEDDSVHVSEGPEGPPCRRETRMSSQHTAHANTASVAEPECATLC